MFPAQVQLDTVRPVLAFAFGQHGFGNCVKPTRRVRTCIRYDMCACEMWTARDDIFAAQGLPAYQPTALWHL